MRGTLSTFLKGSKSSEKNVSGATYNNFNSLSSNCFRILRRARIPTSLLINATGRPILVQLST